MDNILKEYWELILKDKKYLEEHIFSKQTEYELYDTIKRQIEEYFLWRKINSYEELENIAQNENAKELLKFNDYYSDEMCDLLAEHLDIKIQELSDKEYDDLFSDYNLQKIAEESDTTKQLKDCIMIEKESRWICEKMNMYLYLIANNKIEKKQIKSDFGDVKKCAIFVHYSIDDIEKIEKMKNRLITFCKNTLQTDNYEQFIEIGSFLGERNVFHNMLERFENGEFSHLLVTNVGQIYKLSYDMQKILYLTNKIQNLNVTTICVDENKVIKSCSQL